MSDRKTARVILSFIRRDLLDEPVRGDPLAQGALDSLMIEQLAAFIEERFDVQIQDEEVSKENFADLGTLAAFVETKRAVALR